MWRPLEFSLTRASGSYVGGCVSVCVYQFRECAATDTTAVRESFPQFSGFSSVRCDALRAIPVSNCAWSLILCLFARNGNGLLYCILFMISIDLFPELLHALNNVICPLSVWHLFPTTLLFSTTEAWIQRQKQIPEILFEMSPGRETLLKWREGVDRHEIT